MPRPRAALAVLALLLGASGARAASVEVRNKNGLEALLLGSSREAHVVLRAHLDMRDARDEADPFNGGLLDAAANFGRLQSFRVRRRASHLLAPCGRPLAGLIEAPIVSSKRGAA